MKATLGVIYTNSHIAEEFYKYGRVVNKKPEGFFMKPKSEETKAREAADRRYLKRSNICSECHMTKAVGTGTCGC